MFLQVHRTHLSHTLIECKLVRVIFRIRKLSCGGQLACSNEILNRMGQYSKVIDTVDNVTTECLSNCEDQTNDLFVTTSNYPNRKTFKDREEFCILGRKLFNNTYKSPKQLRLGADFPDLCTTLEELPDFLHQCKNNRWRRERIPNKTLALAIESEIYNYAKSNMAIINIFIKEPYSKRFRKTEKMSRIAYIASSGGLLGLCMGFSFVSLAEILYHCFICVSLFFKKSSKSTHIMKDLYANNSHNKGWYLKSKNMKTQNIFFEQRIMFYFQLQHFFL